MILTFAASLLSGVIGSMGMGGGAVLIIYLTLFKKMPQFKAQGINLLFFIPIAVCATAVYIKRKVIEYKTVLPVSAGGMAGVLLGVKAASAIGVRAVAAVFGGGIAILGIYETATALKTILASRKKVCYNKTE